MSDKDGASWLAMWLWFCLALLVSVFANATLANVRHMHTDLCALRLAHAVTARDSAAVRADTSCPTEAP